MRPICVRAPQQCMPDKIYSSMSVLTILSGRESKVVRHEHIKLAPNQITFAQIGIARHISRKYAL